MMKCGRCKVQSEYFNKQQQQNNYFMMKLKTKELKKLRKNSWYVQQLVGPAQQRTHQQDININDLCKFLLDKRS